MSVQVALLRGVNVGGHNRLPMADLRAALQGAGFLRVRTYIQSGNIVLESRTASGAVVAERIRGVIAEAFGLDIPTIVRDAPALAAVVAANPYAAEPDPRRVHAFFLPSALDNESRQRVSELQSAAAAKGSADTVAAIGDVLYLHTPGGVGTSDLAKALSTRGPGLHRSGTARNWATVTALNGMCAD